MRALVFGGSGQIGRAVARDLARNGWEVDAVARAGRLIAPELRLLGVRQPPNADSRTAQIDDGYDAVFDPMAFNASDAADLLAAQDRVGSYVVISTASVYTDEQGRALETAGESGFPQFPDPIEETQATVLPGEGYSAGKVALEQALAQATTPVAILRPGAIHGIGARHPREWYFVKRALDGRLAVPLVDGGTSVFHTSSTLGLASLTRHCVTNRLGGTFNAADPQALSVAEIAAAIGRAMSHRFEIFPAEDLPDATELVGYTPWSGENPLRLSTQAARATGWDGGPDYAACLPDYIDWLVAQAAQWQTAFPAFATYGYDPFDYVAEDAALAPLLRH